MKKSKKEYFNAIAEALEKFAEENCDEFDKVSLFVNKNKNEDGIYFTGIVTVFVKNGNSYKDIFLSGWGEASEQTSSSLKNELMDFDQSYNFDWKDMTFEINVDKKEYTFNAYSEYINEYK